MKKLLCVLFALALSVTAFGRPNVLIITVDDMSCDSVGAYGCKLADTTPHMDQIAAEGFRFMNAHVVVGNCKPSRNVMWSGRYPHNNGVEGFYDVPHPDYPVLCDLMKQGGYYTAIRGKVTHSTPYHPYAWDDDLTEIEGEKMDMKSATSYYQSTEVGIKRAKAAGKPFCLMINISDPHKPFYKGINDPNQPSRVFSAEEVPVPGFLPDHPDVREEVALYYSSVRRADDCVGQTLAALEASGQSGNTVVLFLSDHGMPLPFAKTAVWHHSTHTPWMMRWPGVIKPNTRDADHMVSAVDILPTILEVTEVALPEGLDGKSVWSISQGEKQAERDFIIKEYNENAGAGRNPMRSVQGKRFMYNFNPWSNGERVFKTATAGTASYRAMKKLAPDDAEIAERLDLFEHGVVEELYDIEKDPDALVNLARNPEYKSELLKMQNTLEAWMVKTGDHVLESFRGRDDAVAMERYVADKQLEADARRKGGKKKKSKSMKLLTLAHADTVSSGQPVSLTIDYTLPKKLGTQKIHVTLKQGAKGGRVERKVFEISGTGTLEVSFDVPAEVKDGQLSFAVFVGEAYEQNLQHVTSGPLKVK